MQTGPLHLYIAAVCVLAVGALRTVPWADLLLLAPLDVLGLALLMAFTLLSERLSVGMSFVSRSATQTITHIPLLATALLFGPAAPVVLMIVTGPVTECYIRRKEAPKALFNVAQYVLATSLAGMAFSAIGGTGLVAMETFELQLLPILAFLITVMGVNQGTVFFAIALSQRLRFREVWRQFIGPSGTNALYDVAVSPLAVIVAYFYFQVGWPGLLISLLPLLFIRHAYLNTYRLQHANTDLLKVLVKAIETRDPYTSGHSQRVSGLAGRIARELRLSPRSVEAIEMSALLHDVGKIDAVYSEILRKPDQLTAEERQIIESHVAKGVELLRSLSSVPENVILAVQYHHEREDGLGYPMGVPGSQIPLGAKIIQVCDSIDAMLSDRPYRPALSLHAVRSELEKHSGTQFDVGIAACVLNSKILEEHSASVKKGELYEGKTVVPWRKLVPEYRRGTPQFGRMRPGTTATEPSAQGLL